MKIIFCGGLSFGAIILEEMANIVGLRPALVICRTDKPKGREMITSPSAVKMIAINNNLPVYHPKKDNEDLEKKIREIEPDLVIVAAYNRLIPKEVLEIPKYGFINVHPSLLPNWRGASPLQATILNGDKETGVMIIKMDEIIDHGPIIAERTINLTNPKIKFLELSDQLAHIGAELLIDVVPKLIEGSALSKIQDDEKATYTKIITKEDGRINWNNSAEQIERQIRAYDPWPSAYTIISCEGDKYNGISLKKYNGISSEKYNGKTLKIFNSFVLKKMETGPSGSPGKTYLATNDKIAVMCKDDYLIIDELQIEGGKRMPASDFLMGHKDFAGVMLI
ncbi:MAG: methionyl-tRNA formyltransferase [bacterium]